MYNHSLASPWGVAQRRAGRPVAALAAVVMLALAACGGSAGGSGDARSASPSLNGGPQLDTAAQPFDEVVADFVAPTGGVSTRNLVRLTVWVGRKVLLEECGLVSYMREGDRMDQTLFPDFERIASNGIGVVESLDNPVTVGAPGNSPGGPASGGPPAGSANPSVESPSGPACVDAAMPELGPVQDIHGQWMETIVFPLWSSSEVAAAKPAVTDCFRREIGLSEAELPDLDSFFAALTGLATHWSGLPPEEQRANIEALDAKATEAFPTCGKSFYQSFESKLAGARGGFIDQHHEALEAFAAEMDARGYVP